MREKQLPHISRNFTATLRKKKRPFIFWLIVAIFFLLLSLPLYTPPSSFEKLKSAVLKDYQNPKIHLALAEQYKKANDLSSAKRELLLGLRSQPGDEELRMALGEVENLLSQPKQVQQEINHWEKIAQDFPGYRDAYLKLVQLYFELYQNNKARENLSRALELDPNFEPTRELEKVLRE